MKKLQIEYRSQEWLEFRQSGIGGSEAAAIMGLSPYKSNVELWEEKIGKRKAKAVENKYIDFGNKAETHISALFALDYPCYEVKEIKDVVYQRDFMFASLDGELIEKTTGRLGGHEIKTSEIQKRADWDKWYNRIPDNYYIQVLHYMLVTEWDFWVLTARLVSFDSNRQKISTTRNYFFERSEVLDDLKLLQTKEFEFWECVKNHKRPNYILPSLERKIL